MALLELRDVSLYFGGLKAVDSVDLDIDEGESLAIVGPNGAGKTTLFNIINGVYRPSRGTITFNGKDITKLPTYKRAPLGIGRTFQIPRPFSSATVRENVATGALFGTLSGKVKVQEALEIADRYMDLMGLSRHADKESGALTPVEKKMLEIARALAMKPRLLLMDEAMAGMHPTDIDDMIKFLKKIVIEEGIAVVSMVEHIMRAVAGFAERVVVMHQGAKMLDADTEKALSHPKVIEVYLGRPAEDS